MAKTMDIPQAELVDALADAAVEEALCRLALAAHYGDESKARIWLEHSVAVQEYCRTELTRRGRAGEIEAKDLRSEPPYAL